MLSLRRYSPGVIPTVFLNALLKLAVLLKPHFRSVYKELHADHETGAADNK